MIDLYLIDVHYFDLQYFDIDNFNFYLFDNCSPIKVIILHGTFDDFDNLDQFGMVDQNNKRY